MLWVALKITVNVVLIVESEEAITTRSSQTNSYKHLFSGKSLEDNVLNLEVDRLLLSLQSYGRGYSFPRAIFASSLLSLHLVIPKVLTPSGNIFKLRTDELKVSVKALTR